MKFAVASLAFVLLVAAVHSAPAPQEQGAAQGLGGGFGVNNSPLSQLLQDALLETSANQEARSRPIRQLEMPNSPLSQLLYDILQIPQAALQAVSRLLTNPGNTIGQSFNYASTRRNQIPNA
ncbi:uncharacterized protein LOC132205155 [Neocloeon triangulifer]|uniref:uncharacterized protein LOC132205155 n=1 Tax=Neocloeon triangulifer TaxID=2078957 RepID=UPI00286F3DA7|nr:uncharacterized protein LOC132205155 [Neocloeon triangulifer]